MSCSNCGADNDAGRKFCGACGSPLPSLCAVCGSANPPGVRFCGECGADLTAASSASEAGPLVSPAAERKLVSVLFADLVGFTTLSESRDPEEVRELLSRYFDTCRTLIARYGGTVEKFIGDAVMAVWGAPIANEDDAERAVRAALELTDAVADLGEEIGAPELRVRAGVMTGEAAVTLGAEGQGLVAGDLVNTASRVQSAAPSGYVYVGEAAKRASGSAIAYEDAGRHELKGKSEPEQLWRAVRIVGLLRGVVTSTGLEPPFVGRDRELRLVKEMYHATAEGGHANLVSIVGIGGIGKSRLSWEFEKYFDGLTGDAWWHRGRCLAYGDGVAFWALAEMIRSRAGILEDEDSASASAKLRAAVDEHIPDPTERRFVEPRLAQLLGLEDRGPDDQANLFSAWRLFFERMAEVLPVILVFEDLHWADSALLDFVEHILDWSRERAIFILTQARPELLDRRPTWGAGKRGFTSLFLDPLPTEAMERLLTGPVPGLPDDLRVKILERAEGVPFYAVETVRMLLDRGLIIREGDVFRPAASIETLEVPETLQALIAARLDGLAPEERRLLQDASVLGKSFTVQGLVAVTGRAAADLEPVLTSLVHKEVVGVTTDPMSPERGQYGFLQDLVKKVAYDTMSRKDRKARHLAAATHLLAVGDEDEIIEMVASHLVDAYRADPGAPDAADVGLRARDALGRAGERAASLGAAAQARSYFEQAAELTADPQVQAELIERAGQMAYAAGLMEEARTLYERAMALFEGSGRDAAAATVSARLGDVDWVEGRLSEGVERMERAFEILSAGEPTADLATLAAQLGRLHFFKGAMELALARVETALDIAEPLALAEVISNALNTKGIVVGLRGRREEDLALTRHSLEVALESDVPAAALRAYNNLAEIFVCRDRHDDAAEEYGRGLALARRVGNRFWEVQLLAEFAYELWLSGRWDEALALSAEIPEEDWARSDVLGLLLSLPRIHVNRGELQAASRPLAVYERFETSEDVQENAVHAVSRAVVHRASGRERDALKAADEAFEMSRSLGPDNHMLKESWVEAAEAALALGETSRVKQLISFVDGLRPAEITPSLRAHSARIEARLASAVGSAEKVERPYKEAAGLFREVGLPFWLAVTLTEHGEWLVAQDRADGAKSLLDEAREIFERLQATPWLDRVREAATVVPAIG